MQDAPTRTPTAMEREFPRLSGGLPRVVLGNFPTPVQFLPRLGRELNAGSIWMKHDDQSSHVYGGNKVRKLELLLGDAREKGTKVVLTGGFAGSNHAVATAIHARRLGMDSILFLADQPNASYVRANLLRGFEVGAEQRHFAVITQMFDEARKLAETLNRQGQTAYMIPPGGTSPLGTVGYVNAAFELKAQVEAGDLPVPDIVYVASGTQGTSVGLQLGVKAAGLPSKVIPVRVVDAEWANGNRAAKLLRETAELLRNTDPSFPPIEMTQEELEPRGEFYGAEYACFTPEGMSAVHRLAELEDIKLEGTYTGKTLAALFADGHASRLEGKNVLFWNTYSSVPLSSAAQAIDYHRLPAGFHHYFEGPVQELDR